MGKKSRLTPQEQVIHEKAVKLRKMTDEQLCDYIADLQSTSFGEGFSQGQTGWTSDNEIILRFINTLDGVRGIGAATILKLQKIAEGWKFE